MTMTGRKCFIRWPCHGGEVANETHLTCFYSRWISTAETFYLRYDYLLQLRAKGWKKLISVCFSTFTPLGYDRPERLYIPDLARLDAYLSISSLSCRDIGGFPLLSLAFSYLIPKQFLACLVVPLLPF